MIRVGSRISAWSACDAGITCALGFALPWFAQTIMPIPNHPSATDPAPTLQLRERRYAAERIANELLHADLFTWLPENDGASPQETAVRN